MRAHRCGGRRRLCGRARVGWLRRSLEAGGGRRAETWPVRGLRAGPLTGGRALATGRGDNPGPGSDNQQEGDEPDGGLPEEGQESKATPDGKGVADQLGCSVPGVVAMGT